MFCASLTTLLWLVFAAPGLGQTSGPELERVSTAVPFPRGLAVVDGRLHVLCRGRVRSAGGVSAAVDDQAGTIYALDLAVSEPAEGPVSAAVAGNGQIVARPTDPPFVLWNRAAQPPESDRRTDRPYCTLRYHEPTKSFYICAFSGVDKMLRPDDRVAFSKNLTDAVLRYDLRTGRWSEVERHDLEAGGSYPHHDPEYFPPPHGWPNGPDNCLPLGRWLYVAAKDNSRLIRYDLRELEHSPQAPPPPSEVVLGEEIVIVGGESVRYRGHSALACHDGWLYVGYRTSSVIVRIALEGDFRFKEPMVAELVARFDPFDPRTGRSAELTDLTFDEQGRLYVVSAQPVRIYRFTPDPKRIFDARDGREPAWADLALRTGNPRMKSENILYHDRWLYVTSGDGYAGTAEPGAAVGTVYRILVDVGSARPRD